MEGVTEKLTKGSTAIQERGGERGGQGETVQELWKFTLEDKYDANTK